MSFPQSTEPIEPRPKRWTRAEYGHLVGSGVFDGQRVELIDGEIVEMSPQKELHAACIIEATEALRRCFASGHAFRTQMPLDAGATSVPEPDLAVVAGRGRDYVNHPTTALLIVEVSDTTLDHDRGRKASLYASAGIQDYWILNLIERQLEVLRAPAPDPTAAFGAHYTQRQVLNPGDSLAPLAAPHTSVAVADLLP